MHTIRVAESNFPDKFKLIEYKVDNGLLKDVMEKYDEQLSSENTNLAIGEDRFSDWNISIEECLFYGDSISFFTYNITFQVKFESDFIPITIDKRSYLMSLHSLLEEKLHLDSSEYLEFYFENELLSKNGGKTLEELNFGEKTLVHAIKGTHIINIYANYQSEIIQIVMDERDPIFKLDSELKKKFQLKFPLLYLDNKLIPSSRKSLEYFKIKEGCTIQVQTATENELITVRLVTCSSQIFQIKTRPNDEIFLIKKLLAEKLGIPKIYQEAAKSDRRFPDISFIRFLFEDQRLDDESAWSNYQIENGDIIEVYQEQIAGGGNFADVTKDGKKIGWSNDAPDWRLSNEGLCLEGKCRNKVCKAFNKMVIINIGDKCIFKLNKNRGRQPTNCPMCGIHVIPLTCGFNNCNYRYISIRESNNGIVRIKSAWKKIKDIYYRFDENESVEYQHLLIEVKSLYPSPSQTNITDIIDCSICLETQSDSEYSISSKSPKKFIELDSCKHKFHEDCINKWMKYSRSCPNCRCVFE
jgi:uncharacterized ubiquitin-like protein YukD